MNEEFEQREITEEYLKYFVYVIKTGGKVVFVKESNLLGVSDVNGDYVVLKLADKVIPSEEEADDGPSSDPSG